MIRNKDNENRDEAAKSIIKDDSDFLDRQDKYRRDYSYTVCGKCGASYRLGSYHKCPPQRREGDFKI